MSAGVLAGRLALVTGAASGIGVGCARTLAAAGADVLRKAAVSGQNYGD